MERIKKLKLFNKKLDRSLDITVRYPKVMTKGKVNYLYMHDGQNVLYDEDAIFGKSWDMDKHLIKLEEQKIISPTILVSVDCNQKNEGFERYREFSLYENKDLLKIRDLNEKYLEYGEGVLRPLGKDYLGFIVQELIPVVEDKSVNQRIMMGSSMGGLITHCAGLLYPETFDVLLCLSNAYWYHFEDLIGLIGETKINPNQRYYLDVGTEEESSGIEGIKAIYVNTNKQIYNAMKGKTDRVELNIIEDGKHNEAAWSERVEAILTKYLKEPNEF